MIDARGRGALVPGTVVALLCATAVWVLFVRTAHPLDLEVFLRAGRAVSDGVSPYVPASSPALFSGHAFVYPYLTAWAFAPLSALHVGVAEALYYVCSIGALAVSVRLLAGARPGVGVVLLSFAAEPVARALQLGTLNVWLLLGLAIAWRGRDRKLVVVAALVSLVLAKLFLLPMLAWLLVTGRRRSMWWAGALSVLSVVLGCALANLSVSDFVHMLGVLSAHETPQSSSLSSRLIHLGIGSRAAMAVSAVLAAAVIVAGWWRYRRSLDERAVFCACVLASLVLSPIVWSHYWMLLLVVPLLWRWGVRASLSALVVTWLVSAPIGVPALQAVRAAPDVAWWLGSAAVLVIAVAMWPTIRAVRVGLRRSHAG